MGSKSMFGVVAVMLAAAAIGAGTTFAQTPVAPAPTVAAQPDDQSKVEKPTDKAPKLEKPTDNAPKLEKPTDNAPKLEKPTDNAPKLEKVGKQREEKPTSDKSKPAQPNPETSKPAQPELAEPERAQAGAPSAQPDGPGPKPHVDVAKPASPTRKSAPSVPVSGVRHVIRTRGAAAKQNRQVVRRRASPAGPERSAASSARSGGDSADATPVASEPAAVTRRRAPHLAFDGVAGAAAAASLDPQQPRVLILSDPAGYKVVPLLLAIVFATGVGYLFGRELRHGSRLVARRPAPTQRGARPRRPAARGRERVERQFRERLLRTRSGRPRARRRLPRHPSLGRAGAAVATFLWPSVRLKYSRRRPAGTENGYRAPSAVRPLR